LIDAASLLRWMYDPQSQVQLTGPAHQLLALPTPDKLLQLVAMAQEEGRTWALLDGPRPARAGWLLDIWWNEQPEMSPTLLAATQARCLPLKELASQLSGVG